VTHTVTLVADSLGTTAPKVIGHQYYVDAVIDVTDLDDALTTTGDFAASPNTFRRTSGDAMLAYTIGQALAITNAADSGNNATVTVTDIAGDLVTLSAVDADETGDEVTLSKVNVLVPYSDLGLGTVTQVMVTGQEDLTLDWRVELGTDGETITSDYVFVRARNSEFNYSENPSFISGSTGEVIYSNFINNPQVYPTTIGLYNDANELMAVAKLSKPLLKDFTKESLVRVKLDF